MSPPYTQPRFWNLFDRDVLRWLRESIPERAIIAELLELRRAVEPEAASLAALRANREEIARIAAGMQKMRAAGRGRADAIEADCAFHEAIILATGNRFYQPMAEVIRTALSVTAATTNAYYESPVGDLDLHDTVLRAIQARDPERARRAMHSVLDSALAAVDRSGVQSHRREAEI